MWKTKEVKMRITLMKVTQNQGSVSMELVSKVNILIISAYHMIKNHENYIHETVSYHNKCNNICMIC